MYQSLKGVKKVVDIYVVRTRVKVFKFFKKLKNLKTLFFLTNLMEFSNTFEIKLLLIKQSQLEAIHLCLTGTFRGRYLKNNLTQDIFNNEIVNQYIEEIKINKSIALPEMLIELYFDDLEPLLKGMENSEGKNEASISFCVKFDNKYQEEYETLKQNEEIVTLPIEYYKNAIK